MSGLMVRQWGSQAGEVGDLPSTLYSVLCALYSVLVAESRARDSGERAEGTEEEVAVRAAEGKKKWRQ